MKKEDFEEEEAYPIQEDLQRNGKGITENSKGTIHIN